MRALIVMLSLCAVVAFSDASDYRWRLSRQQVLAIAERALVAQHFKPSEYPERTVEQRNQKWYVDFAPRHLPLEVALDQDVLVVIDDETGEAKVYHGA